MAKVSVFGPGYTMRHLDMSVLDEARARMARIFDMADTVTVSFSGGKDSTVVLALALEEARKRGRLPQKVTIFDEEVIDPDTLAFAQQVASWEEVEMQWYCIPVRHTIRSINRAFWWPWDPDEKDVWVRTPPEFAITELEGFPRKYPVEPPENGINTAMHLIYDHPETYGKVAEVVGVRVQESFNRRRAVLSSGNYIHERGRMLYCKPIFDWGWSDVWRYIFESGWPYSKFYDKMRASGVPPHLQRVAPWGNVAQSRDVRFWPEFYPDFWGKAIRRLPELRAQSLYGNTKLFRAVQNKPAGITWQEYTYRIIDQLPTDRERNYWTKHVKNVLKKWARSYTIPFPDEAIQIEGYGKETLQSWHRLAMIISKNDMTGRDKT